MGQCKWCGKSGFFVRVDELGLCSDCEPVVLMDLQQRQRIIEDSVRIINESTKTKTRISRCDLVIEHATALLPYEKKGISLTNPPLSELARQIGEIREEVIAEAAGTEVEKALAKAELAQTSKTAVSAASKGLLKLRELKQSLGDVPGVAAHEERLKVFIHKAQLDAFLEAARKAEFKGNRKKAVDQYQEALYFLKTDDIDDAQQADTISEIESKVEELTKKDAGT